MKYQAGQRIIFRESESGPPELGTIVMELPATETHQNGGEYEISIDNAETCLIAWVGELEAA